MPVIYLSLDANFESCNSIKAKIAKIDAIINELLNTALKSVTTGNHLEYSIDTGQSIQKVTYRSPLEITKVIQAYREIRQQYVNEILGNEFQQVDGKNLRGRFC